MVDVTRLLLIYVIESREVLSPEMSNAGNSVRGRKYRRASPARSGVLRCGLKHGLALAFASRGETFEDGA